MFWMCAGTLVALTGGVLVGTRVNSFSVGRRTDVWDLSQYFQRRLKGRRLGLESIVFASVEGQTSRTRVNSFSIGRRAEVWDVTRVLGILFEKKIRVSQLWENGN